MKANLLRRLLRRRGQTTTEYMLVISVIVIGVVAVTWDPMMGALSSGTQDYNSNFTNGSQAGVFTSNVPHNR
jgi:hypothetical protein